MNDIHFGKDFLWGGGFAANQMEGAAFEVFAMFNIR